MEYKGEIERVNPLSSCIGFMTHKGFELNDLKTSGQQTIEIEKFQEFIDGAISFLRQHEQLGEPFITRE